MLIRKQTRRAGTTAVLCFAMTAALAHAQIVSDADGQIDLTLRPFFDTQPAWSDELQKWIPAPTESQHETIPVGLSDVSGSINGAGYYSVGGLSTFDYQYLPIGVGQAWFGFHAYADSLDAGDGAGGHAALNLRVTFPQAVRYRFEAEVIDVPVLYEVSFNGREAEAWYDAFGIYGGTFPPTFHYDNPMPDGWDTYVDEGILPAGTYDLSVAAYSRLHRYGIGLDSEGTASLHVQLLGDADYDGLVGIADMNIILANWNQQVPAYASDMGDLDGDGLVGIADLGEVLGGWGADVRPVPEPAGVALALALSLAMTGRRRSR